MKKILITGITGLLGSYLAKKLAGEAQLSGIKRPGSSTHLLGGLAENINWYEGEITDVEMLAEACSEQDLVIHSAGLVSFDDSKKEALLKTNTYATACLVNALLTLKKPKLVFISSVAALGREGNDSPINEEKKWVNSKMNTPYGISKHLAELEVWRGAQEGLQVMVFNPSVLLGKVEDERSSSQIYRYVLDENRYFPLGNVNYIDIRDAVNIMVQLIDRGEWNERYIISKESLSYETFFREMAAVFGKKAPQKPLSNWLSSLVVSWASFQNRFSNNKIPISRQTIRAAQSRIVYDNGKIKNITGFSFTPLRDTLQWAMDKT
ncbi:NAD-dependent epimerase/dehydratase family protein [Cyclobacterium plantarum]|uniref:NAD-dependent epimerase/dehydratase family protein n=1 Tax=Cyclobacterium plantarum TaxID=2716263 RepID=A0ABX0H4T1_9BACT|nr:NAD-dependent epimerase/dehydratase family protein [Cyclobacterium plantarum]NHE56841.1 NAD-dependent epimerase/dehydratase family protein [Cyclobacterium plantarum]